MEFLKALTTVISADSFPINFWFPKYSLPKFSISFCFGYLQLSFSQIHWYYPIFYDRADVIQRKFTITKALLFKADRSSFDRLRQQVGTKFLDL